MSDDETARQLALERESLERRLAAREGQPGYASNVAAIKARLAEIRALQGESLDDEDLT